MAYPIKTCVVCGEEFELKPNKPGYANRCPDCSEPEAAEEVGQSSRNLVGHPLEGELNEARRKAMRDLLYRREE